MESTWRDRVCGRQLVDYRNFLTGKPVLRLDYLIDLFKTKVRLDLRRVMDAKAFLEYVLTDFNSGEAAYFSAKRPDIFDLMRASSALPRVYPVPVLIDGRPYYDGGQSDPIPVRRAIDCGATHILVLRTREAGYLKKPKFAWEARLLFAGPKASRAAFLALHDRYNASVSLIENPPNGVRILSIGPEILHVS